MSSWGIDNESVEMQKAQIDFSIKGLIIGHG